MNHFTKRDGRNKFSIIVIIFACVLFSNVPVFGQTTVESTTAQTSTIQDNEVVNTNVKISTIKQEVHQLQRIWILYFGLWVLNKGQILVLYWLERLLEKQFTTSGFALNGVLIRALLEKAVNYESAIV